MIEKTRSCTRWLSIALTQLVASAALAQPLSVEEMERYLTALQRNTTPHEFTQRVAQLVDQYPEDSSPIRLMLRATYASLLSAQDKAKEGYPIAESAWKIASDVYGADSEIAARALAAYLDACPGAGKAKSCEVIAMNAKNRWSDADTSRQSSVTADVLRSVALIENYVGRPQEAIKSLDVALSIWTREAARNETKIRNAMNGKAVLLSNLGQDKAALDVADTALKTFYQPGQQPNDDLVSALRVKARALGALGRVEEALLVSREAYDGARKVSGDLSLNTLRAQEVVGTNLIRAGKFSEGLLEIGRAKDVVEQRFGSASTEALTLRYRYADSLWRSGLQDEGVESLAKLVDDFQREHGEAHPQFAIFKHSLGRNQAVLGDFDSANETFKKSIALFTTLRGAGHPETLIANVDAYAVEIERGALVPTKVVSEITDKLRSQLAPNHPYVQASQLALGKAMLASGEYQQAVSVLTPLLDTRTSQLGGSHLSTLITKSLLARALLKSGQLESGEKICQQLLVDMDVLRYQYAVLGTAAQRELFRNLLPVLNDYVVHLASTGRLQKAFLIADAIRGRSLHDHQTAMRTQKSSKARELAVKISSLESELLTARSRESRESLLTTIQGSRRELHLMSGNETRVSPSPTLDATDGFEWLKADQAYVHYVADGSHNWYAFVARRNGELRWVELGPLASLASTVHALNTWTAALGQRRAPGTASQRVGAHRHGSGSENYWWSTEQDDRCHAQVPADAARPCVRGKAQFVSTDQDYVELRHYLGARLLKPLLPYLGDASRVVISPDQSLAVLAWDVLMLDSEIPAAKRFAISTTPSLSLYKNGLQTEGNSSYERDYFGVAATDAIVLDDVALPKLPFAAGEVLASARHFPLERTKTLLHGEASEAKFRSYAASGELSRYRYLHIAAHGYFDSSRRAKNGLLLSRTGGSYTEDGLITLTDWQTFPIRAHLVVLSACESGMGRMVAGEGVVGYGFTLKAVGVNNLVATLWRVSDRASSKFISEFFARLRNGDSPEIALAETKRSFIAHRDVALRSPRVWAAFTLYQ